LVYLIVAIRLNLLLLLWFEILVPRFDALAVLGLDYSLKSRELFRY